MIIKPIRKDINKIILKHKIINIFKNYSPYAIRKRIRQLNRKLNYIKYSIQSKSTNKVYCPIEQREFNVFPKGLTPTTGAKQRHRLFWLFLERETDILNDGNVILHCAPQFGIQKRLKSYPKLNYIAGDKHMDGYDYTEDTIDVDLLDIPFSDNYFDYIICNRVLEHIEDDARVYSEMQRVLKKGGIAYITVPLDEDLDETHESFKDMHNRIKYYGQWDHVRMYGLDIKKRIEAAGFTVKIEKYSDNFTKEEFKKYGLCVDWIITATKK